MPTDSIQTVRDLVELFSAQQHRGSPRALAETFRVLGQFVALLGDKPIGELRPADLMFWVQSNRQWQSCWTVRRVYSSVRRPFSWAARLRVIDRDPFVGLSHPCGQRGRPMTDEELRAILAHTDKWFRRIVFFAAITGARTSEVAAIEWPHLDLRRGCVVLTHHKTKHVHGRNRVIVLSQVLLDMLASIRKSVHVHPRFVFTNKRGTPWTRHTIARKLARLVKRIGLDRMCRFYGLRHRFGTEAIMRGLDIKTVAEMMGHASIRMTEHYIHLAGKIDHLKEAAERMAK